MSGDSIIKVGIIIDCESRTNDKYIEVLWESGRKVIIAFPEPMGFFYNPTTMKKYILSAIKTKNILDRKEKINEILD